MGSDTSNKRVLETLRIPSATPLEAETDTQPSGVLEEQLLILFKLVLLRKQQAREEAESAIASMTVVSDFFDYGGNSSSAVDLHMEIQSLLPELSMQDDALNVYRTPRALAAHIHVLQGNVRHSPHTHNSCRRQWIVCCVPRPHAELRLFIVPEAGVGASQYYSWQRVLKDAGREDQVELCFVQLPGREERSDEPLYIDFAQLVAELVHHFLPYLADGKTYGIYGHALGALLGFEVARALRRAGHALPASLCLSGCSAPHIPASAQQGALEMDSLFLTPTCELEETPEGQLEEQTRLQRSMPLFRADFSLLQSYEFTSNVPQLPISVAIWGGLQDRIVRESDILAWKEIQDCSLHFVHGNHCFHQEPLIRLLIVATQCATLLHQRERQVCTLLSPHPELKL